MKTEIHTTVNLFPLKRQQKGAYVYFFPLAKGSFPLQLGVRNMTKPGNPPKGSIKFFNVQHEIKKLILFYPMEISPCLQLNK